MVVILLTTYRFFEIKSLSGYSVLYQREDNKPIVIFSLFFILLFGFRPISMVFWDTVNYDYTYKVLQTYGTTLGDLPAEFDSDWLFYHFMALCAQVIDVHYFFVIVMYFYVVMMYTGCRKIDLRHGATLMLFCIGAFSFYGYAVNGIRNGVACSFVILAIAGVCKGERVLPIVLSFVAIGCHKSMALPVACMYTAFFVRNPRWMFLVWFGSIAVSLAFGEAITNVLSLITIDERVAEMSKTGEEVFEEWGRELENHFRWDFLLYSSMPILIGAYTLFVRKVYNHTYIILLGTYMYANAFWVIVIRDLFSNRFAYLSWFLYPIVLAYPLFNLPVFEKNHSQKTAWILLAHLGFTVVMWMLGK